jgi:2-oxoglutarate ferredoxin oxidoreductase subunit delta
MTVTNGQDKNDLNVEARKRKKDLRGKDPERVRQEKEYEHVIFKDWCKACGICSAFCPKKVIGRDEAGAPVIERPEACIACRFCEIHCPDFAITIRERSDSHKEEDL